MLRKCLQVSPASRSCREVSHWCRQKYSNYNPSRIITYNPPDWAKQLKAIPSSKVELFQSHTPIHNWKIPRIPGDIDVYIKRDDMTGCALSGTKVRKLEFLLGEALSTDCRAVITCGGVQSNLCRATAVAATQLGMETHLLLLSNVKNISKICSDGNMFLNKLMGAKLYLIPTAQEKMDLIRRMQTLAEKLQILRGIKAYTIPIGGSNAVGLHGYLCGWQELIEQGVLDKFDDVVLAISSGETAAGISIGNYLTGSKLRIHGFTVCYTPAYCHSHINDTLASIGLYNKVKSEEIITIYEVPKVRGYSTSSSDELGGIFSMFDGQLSKVIT